MPLVRFEVRNEYGLGLPELYKEANREDPKAVLDGVAVAGLVGILRQLGDLAEFAAEVFHGLQEQVTITSSRSHKLMVRVQNIEAALPQLEKAILAQRSHLHFAYTTGSDWRFPVRSEQNHFIYSDLPRFIMDSYEECRGPPRLHLLDKFDTRGPGSCLKRYSDPTFFKKASAGLDEANVQKVQRVKKDRRSKKKRMWPMNGEVSHGLLSSHSGRMQFASPNFDGQTSLSVSTFDVALKSELSNRLNSFDSRTGSSYIECVFHPSYSTESEENETKEFSSSQLKKHHNDTLDSASLDGQSRVVDDIQSPSSQKQTGSGSPCVSWDEKTEIMETSGQKFDRANTTEMLSTNFDLDPQEGGAINFRTFDQMAFHFDNEIVPTSVSGGNQLDDIEGEVDNYIDALNTIESDSETDLDCQTKREVDQYSSLNDKAADRMQRLTAQNSDDSPSNFEYHVPAYISSDEAGHNPNLVSPESHMEACSSSNNQTSGDKPNSVFAECYATVQQPEMADKSSIPDILHDIDLCVSADILEGSNVETVVNNLSSSGSREPISQALMSEKIISNPCESQKFPSGPSGVHSIMVWTNGGLLGLEPSKPPDFSVLNAVSQNLVARSKDDKIGPSSQSNILEGDGNAEKPNILVKSSNIIEQVPSSKCYLSCHNDEQVSISIKKTSLRFSPADLDVKLEQSSDVHQGGSFDNAHRQGFNETNTMTLGPEWPISPDIQVTQSNKEDDQNSSRVFAFSNRLLVNGFRRQLSLDHDNNPASSVRSISEQTNTHQSYQNFSGRTFTEQLGSGSPIMSPSSSPPLEHMKISFQPIDGFETSKLKLKFPDGSNCREASGDMLPSFHLLPEPDISLHDIDSDFDEDTFCRSSPYVSDDCLSHHSESNSEQWESGESPRSKDEEIYDALWRISPIESVSSSLETGGTAHGGISDNCGLQYPFAEDSMEPFQFCHLLDLPSFCTLNPSFKQELINDSDAKHLLESQFPKEPTPPSPLLPPLQRQGIKQYPNVATEKQDTLSEGLNYVFNLKFSAPTISQQPKPAPIKKDQNIEAIVYTPKSKQPDWQKVNRQKEANQTANGNDIDEKDDFLNQIRTKSFNLRRIVKEPPTFTTGASTNVKVTAILEKANAIRQAVGSDDGDDENWSDS